MSNEQLTMGSNNFTFLMQGGAFFNVIASQPTEREGQRGNPFIAVAQVHSLGNQ